MLVVLSGGTGGAKLIEGLSHEIDAAQLTVVCNTADDFVLHGLNISPDLDTILYTLAGMSDSAKGWGIQDDTFAVLTQLERLGGETWFKLGDRDIATHITRTCLLRAGLKLSDVTADFGTVSVSKPGFFPCLTTRIETRVETPEGEISFPGIFRQTALATGRQKGFLCRRRKEPSCARCARSYRQRRRDHHLSEQSCDQYRPDPGSSWD